MVKSIIQRSHVVLVIVSAKVSFSALNKYIQFCFRLVAILKNIALLKCVLILVN